MILLDTTAVIWMLAGHRRARPLAEGEARLYVSPATLLELHYLEEAGRLRVKRTAVRAALDDDRWDVDEPPALAWFEQATQYAWTTEPFDRLIVAHARLRRWRLATADQNLLERLDARYVLEL